VSLSYLTPQWDVPRRVRAAFTLRAGGISRAPFETLNSAEHVGDSQADVAENRRRIGAALALPEVPVWVDQVHGTAVLDLDRMTTARRADAVIARTPRRVCVVQVADCLPVMLAARDASAVGVAHCGWRGLAAGVLEATVRALETPPSDLRAWLGPAIGPHAFEVGEEVRAAFVAHDSAAAQAFEANPRGRWQCDLFGLARQRLHALGIAEVTGGGLCTYSDPERFFSYRRDGRCGRMAALIWLEAAHGPPQRAC
jgi:YfiH family protein